jgi:hypothetical protein
MNNWEEVIKQLNSNKLDHLFSNSQKFQQTMENIANFNLNINSTDKLAKQVQDTIRFLELPINLTKLNQGAKINDILKQLDQKLYTPIPDSIFKLEQQQQQMIRGILNEVTNFEKNRRLLLESAISPLPDFLSLINTHDTLFRNVQIAINNINQAIVSGEYLGTIQRNEKDEIIVTEENEAKESIIEIIDPFVVRFWEICQHPEIMKSIEGRDFERFIAILLEKLGNFVDIQLTSASGDGGTDIIATHNVCGIETIMMFQCKRYKNKIGVDKMRELYGTIQSNRTLANKGILVTTSSFTKGAKEYIISETPLLDGKDFHDVVNWIKSIKN